MKMRDVAQRLIQEERSRNDAKASPSQPAFRVCEKLRRSLATLVGLAGFRLLLSRALMLAKAEVAWLDKLRVAADGSLELPATAEAQLSEREAAEGGRALVAQLLDLLVTFIGEGLTLRLVQDCWPKVALKDSVKDSS